jgi:hypothetical protein
MSVSVLARAWLAVAAEAPGQDIALVNSGANPYRVIRDWAQLTLEKRPWGGSNGVDVDRDGKTVWATDRCSPGTVPGCLGSKANPIHHFDQSGKELDPPFDVGNTAKPTKSWVSIRCWRNSHGPTVQPRS